MHHHHHITRAIAEAHAADLQRTAARTRPTAPIHPRHRRRAIGAALAALAATAALAPTGAVARPADNVTARWQAYDQTIAKLPPEELAAAYGDRPTAKVGDTPADFPNASRAPQYHGPATVEVVRPERTIIHDADHALPIVLAGLALLVALAGTGFAATRSRTRPGVRA